jgi:hypothetical protein
LRLVSSFVPVAVIVVLAAGITVVTADSGEHGVAFQQNQGAVIEQRPGARPSKVSPVIDPPAPAVVDPGGRQVLAPARVAAPPTLAVVEWSTRPAAVPGNSPNAQSRGPAPVNLGTAASFAILTKSGVTDVPGSSITGNVGASPITGAAVGLSCSEVRGKIYSVNAAGALPCRVTDAPGLTAAVSDEESAYTDAAGRTNPGFVNLGAGQIGGLSLAPGLYRWSTGVSISQDVTLAGGPDDVWIFQIAGSLSQASATTVRLTGGAQARNVFWQSAGAVTLGTTAHLEGTILSKTMIALNTGASTQGRLLAQTQVTLQQNTVTNVQ